MGKEDTIREVSIQEGYAFWAGSYDQESNALIDLEEAYVAPLLTQLPFTNVLDVGTGTEGHLFKRTYLPARRTIVLLDHSCTKSAYLPLEETGI